MKNSTRLIIISHITLLLICMLVLFLGCGIHVEPAHSVEVQNNLDKPVIIFSRSFIAGEWGEVRNWGRVEPGKRRAVFSMVPFPTPEDNMIYVEAKGLDGKVIQKWEFPAQERILLVIDNTDLEQ